MKCHKLTQTNFYSHTKGTCAISGIKRTVAVATMPAHGEGRDYCHKYLLLYCLYQHWTGLTVTSGGDSWHTGLLPLASSGYK